MALPSLVQTNTEDTPPSSLSFSMGSNFTAGNTAFWKATYWDDGGPISAVTLGGDAATLDARHANGDGSYVEVWRVSNLTGGSAAVSVTSGGSWGGNYLDSRVEEWSNLDLTSPIIAQPAQNTGSSANPAPTTTGTLSASEGVAFTLLGHGAAGSAMTEPSGWTRSINIDDYFGSSSGAQAYFVFSSNTALAPVWTSGAVAWRCGTIVYKSAATTGPTIDTQPTSAHVAVGDTANFTVAATATGGGTLSYQWKLGGVDVSTGSGGTTASYTTAALALTDDLGSYTCAVTETGGSNDGTTTSSAATLRVGIIYVGSGAAAYSGVGTSPVSPAYPAGLAAGDLLVTLVDFKPPTASPNTGTIATPGSWSRGPELTAANDGNTGGYSATIAADTGNVGAWSFYLTATGSESGSLAIALTGVGGTGNAASTAWAVMHAYRAPPGYTWSVAGSTGKQTSAPGGGAVSQAMAGDPGVSAGDFALFGMMIPTDVNGALPQTTWSGAGVTQTGVTYDTAVITDGPFTPNGDDCGGVVAYARAASGTSGGVPTVAVTKGGTSANARGPILFLRIRAETGSEPAAVAGNTLFFGSL